MKNMIMMMTAMATAGLVSAGTVRENCGCGLGSMALGDETGLVSHVVAVTLNGISGNQTFGVSSGTLDCDQSTTLVSTRDVEVFVADNLDHIAIEAANGEGAYLAALADLLQIEVDQRDNFYLSLQLNFNRIFTGENSTAANVTRSIVQLI
ncbi:MAG: DUF3015 family protein [Verrucomicrobia bacterium]|nr:DUF3015 family protein [Verrucomicrobiota bacterium]MCH8510802.1 DUF3015 domain-containing protein [Kiritimatiellia bacterium]